MSDHLTTRDDGRYEHVFHQSWLNEFMECPEMARLDMLGLYPQPESSAMARGTALHTAAECVLLHNMPYKEALAQGQLHFRELSETEGFVWDKPKTRATAIKHIAAGFSSWYVHIYPRLGAARWIEHGFDFVLYENEQRVVRIAGWVDYAEVPAGIKDWKLTGNQDKYKAGYGGEGWKLKRWGIQPTFYAAAAYHEGLFAKTDEVPFEYVALNPLGRTPQVLQAPRTWNHVEWLKEQLESVCLLIESHLPVWPLRDQQALCSPVWCPAWDACKGKHFPTTKEIAIDQGNGPDSRPDG